jgi:hypothetical protein
LQPLAVASLVLSVLAYGALPVVGALGGVVCGHAARRAFQEEPGRYRGQTASQVGLWLGYVQLGLVALIMVGVLALVAFGAFTALLR